MFATVKTMMSKATSRVRSGGYEMWMPNLPMVLLHAEHATPTTPASAVFRVLPKMTKHEVKEYLLKIYNLPVVQVRTQNYLGKRRVIRGKRAVAYTKRPDFKKAFVTFDNTIADTGVGCLVKGLQSNSPAKPT
jgi:large subunit ribosomal protein L23